jgi:glutamate-ammonia-ligase adenylyltransferase
MKRQIQAVKGHEQIAVAGHDVKLGRGGIREIEFFVQTQQLVFGGRKPALRGRATLDMLQELWRGDWITEAAAAELSEAYRFLRMVEHRLQMVEDQQTQRLPRDKVGVESLARFCGLTASVFRKRLTGHLRLVERHYARLFEDAPELTSGEGSLVFTGVADDPETLRTLKRMGFQRPEAVAETVRGWHFGRRAGIVTPRAREVLTELTPALLEAFGRSGDPDGGLLALDSALQRMPAVVELFTILRRNAPLRLLFAEILGSAPRLSEVVVQRPHVLDALVDAEFTLPPDAAALEGRFQERLSAAADLEEFLDQVRDLARAERFLVGARLFSGILTPAEAGEAHAAVAGATIAACLSRVAADIAAQHGAIPGARMAILGLGKLGSREMTALSDLDLIVIYDAPEALESDGRRPIAPSEYYARLTQRLVTALTVATKRGGLYDVDLRLRPSGGKGPVAVSLSAFRAYHAHEAETWERMAITRARLVAGDHGLAPDVAAVIADSARLASRNPALLSDIRQMRALVGKEKPSRGRFDLKRVPGGLVDIEFAAQALLLRHPEAGLAGEGPDVAAALQRLVAAGNAMPQLAERLVSPWRLQSALAQWLALAADGRVDPEKTSPALRRRLAQAVGLPDFAVLSGELAEAQEAAQRAVAEILGR